MRTHHSRELTIPVTEPDAPAVLVTVRFCGPTDRRGSRWSVSGGAFGISARVVVAKSDRDRDGGRAHALARWAERMREQSATWLRPLGAARAVELRDSKLRNGYQYAVTFGGDSAALTGAEVRDLLAKVDSARESVERGRDFEACAALVAALETLRDAAPNPHA